MKMKLLLVPLICIAACDAAAEPDLFAPDDPSRLIDPGDGGDIPPNDGSAPTYGSLAEVPYEIRFAKIYSTNPSVSFQGNMVKAYSTIDYWGNRVTQEFNLHLQNQNGGGSQHKYPAKKSHFWGGVKRFWGMPFSFSTPSGCGQVANLIMNYEVKQLVFFDWKLTTLDVDYANRTDYADQPQCAPESDSPGTKDPWGDREVDSDPYCVVFFLYDTNTGEIVEWWILYCTEKS